MNSRAVLLVSVRNSEGRIRLYCKGADIVLFERLHPCNQELMSITSDHLNVSSRGDAWSCAATWCPQTAEQPQLFSPRWNRAYFGVPPPPR